MVEQNTLRRLGTGLIVSDPAAASPGYTLFAPLTGTGQAYLAGLDGTVAHQWDLPYRPGRHARLLPNGNLPTTAPCRTRPCCSRCGAAKLFPDATNAIFRAYRYAPDEVPWLS